MKNAIILHGMPSKDEYYSSEYPSASNSHWVPWLQKQLQINGIAAHTPEIPDAWNPNYNTWLREFERYTIGPETVLVGHSMGGGFIVRWLSEHPDIEVDTVVLVAPWIDPAGELKPNGFYEFQIDPSLAQRIRKLVIFNSDNDQPNTQKSARMIADVVPNTKWVEFHNYGHFTYKHLKTDKLPELINEICGTSATSN